MSSSETNNLDKCLKTHRITTKDYVADINKNVTSEHIKTNKCSYFCQYFDSGYINEQGNFKEMRMMSTYIRNCGGQQLAGDKCVKAFRIRMCTDKTFSSILLG